MTEDSLTVDSLAKKLYMDAWGKGWPYTSSGKISMEDIFKPGEEDRLLPNSFGDNDDRLNPADDLDDEDSKFPTEWEYTCLQKMNFVANACGGARVVVAQDVLVIRPEYLWLEKTIESGYLASANAVVVTGHPGTGKTMFLLYLLLSRLQRRLPTVVQLTSSTLVVFNDRGGFAESSDTFFNLKGHLVLMDSNVDSVCPAPAFRWSQPRVIRAAPPQTSRWRAWARESSAEVVITALPTPLEIGAAVKESGRDYAQAGGLIQKWGPCTRTILELIGDGHASSIAAREEALFAKVHAAAVKACQNPHAYDNMDQLQRAYSISTDLVFIHPRRPRDPVTDEILRSASNFNYMPTTELMSTFHEEFRKLLRSSPKSLAVDTSYLIPLFFGHQEEYGYG